MSVTNKYYTIELNTVLYAGVGGTVPVIGAIPPVYENPIDPDFLIENYTADQTVTALPNPPFTTSNWSGATYDATSDRFIFIQNNTSMGGEVTLAANQTVSTDRTIDFNHNGSYNDTEAVEILLDKDIIAVGSENAASAYITLHDWVRGDIDLVNSGQRARWQVAVDQADTNSGLEAIAYNPDLEINGVIYGGLEGQKTAALKKLLRIVYPVLDNVDYTYLDAELEVDEILNFNDRWESAVGAYDISDFALAPNGHLLIISDQANKIYQIDVEDLFTNRNGAGQSAEDIIIVSELALESGYQYEGVALGADNQLMVTSEPNWYWTFAPPVIVAPVISALTLGTVVTLGNTFTESPTLAAGTDVFWFKEYGPDDMTVDQETGAVSWDTTGLARGQGVAFAVGANNSEGEDIKWGVIHVDNISGSKARIMGEFQDDLGLTLSSYIVLAASQINGGDTLIIPEASYPVSVASDESYENGFGVGGIPYAIGNASQFTTIAGADPGGVIIDGQAHDAIPIAKKAVQLSVITHSPYIKMMGFECKTVQRGGFVCDVEYAISELISVGDVGWAQTPTDYDEAELSYASIAGLYLQGDHSTIDSCFAYGQWRYGLQMGNPTEFNLMMRSTVRGDDYHGGNPRGLFAMYSTKNSGQFNDWGLDADQEDFCPFYKNAAGAFTYPATGNETYPEFLQLDGCGAINCQTSMGQIDGTTADVASFKNIVGVNLQLQIGNQWLNPPTNTSYSRQPATFGSDDQAEFRNLSIDNIDPNGEDFGDPATSGGFRSGASSRYNNIYDSIFSNIGWTGADTVAFGPMFATTGGPSVDSSVDNTNVYNFKGTLDVYGFEDNLTNMITTDPKLNGWDYPPRVEAGSPLATAGIGADVTNFKNPNMKMQGDTDWDTETTISCWPMPAETIWAEKARGYTKTGIPTRASALSAEDWGTGNLDGNRGGSVVGESYSEYIWGQFGRTVPPLRVSVKQTASGELTFRIGKYRSTRGETITKFNIYNKTDLVTPLAVLSGTTFKAVISGFANASYSFVIRAVDTTKIDSYTANESGESGNSYDLDVTVT